MLNAGSLVCLDEIQRLPGLFPVMRGIGDEPGRNGSCLVFGSASPGLLRQSSESLAGMIACFELTPFLCEEVATPGDSGALRLVPCAVRRFIFFCNLSRLPVFNEAKLMTP